MIIKFQNDYKGLKAYFLIDCGDIMLPCHLFTSFFSWVWSVEAVLLNARQIHISMHCSLKIEAALMLVLLLLLLFYHKGVKMHVDMQSFCMYQERKN